MHVEYSHFTVFRSLTLRSCFSQLRKTVTPVQLLRQISLLLPCLTILPLRQFAKIRSTYPLTRFPPSSVCLIRPPPKRPQNRLLSFIPLPLPSQVSLSLFTAVPLLVPTRHSTTRQLQIILQALALPLLPFSHLDPLCPQLRLHFLNLLRLDPSQLHPRLLTSTFLLLVPSTSLKPLEQDSPILPRTIRITQLQLLSPRQNGQTRDSVRHRLQEASEERESLG